jgi:hypothetical protein
VIANRLRRVDRLDLCGGAAAHASRMRCRPRQRRRRLV